MKTAIVTGASGGIGLSFAKRLIERNYRVYALARDFTKTNWTHENFVSVHCDVSDSKSMISWAQDFLDKEKHLYVLINNAGVGYFGPHEQLKPQQIEEMIHTNLLAPLILINRLLRKLKESKGIIINVSSITAKKSSSHGCTYGATKAGMTHFGISLFDEVRKHGVKVVTIHPDMTNTGFYDNLEFTFMDDPLCYIETEQIAQSLDFVLDHEDKMVVTDITIRPQKNMIHRKLKT